MMETTDIYTAMINQEEPLLHRALGLCMKAYGEKPSAENYKNMAVAKQALEIFLKNKQAPEEQPSEGQRLIGMNAVLQYLKTENWKISQSKLYEDRLLIKKQKDGSMLKTDVDKYAVMCLEKKGGSDVDVDISEKYRWEVQIAKQKDEQLTRRNEIEAGMYILKSEVEQQFAARAAYLKSSLGMDFIQSHGSHIIRLVNGDQQLAPELITYWLEQIEQIFDYYAKPIQFSAKVAEINITKEAE